jgi:hypothetical protein
MMEATADTRNLKRLSPWFAGWYTVRELMRRQSVKISWDMLMAVAALRERGVTVQGTFEDAKVGVPGPSHHS